MIYEISNEYLNVSLCDAGGEMQSVKLLGKDRLWCGNPEFWKYHAPFLFPIVGKLNNGETFIGGKQYLMNQHGLCRISLHKVVEKSENSITFCFYSSEETKKAFPYDFEFYTRYTLVGKKIEIIITIKNIGENNLLCSVGAHPAFPIDLHDGDKLCDYEIQFEKEEDKLVRMYVNSDGLYTHEEKFETTKIVPIDEESLNGTIIFKNFKSDYVSLIRKGTKEKVSSYLGGHEIIAFWKGVGAKFLCLEPWNGIADPAVFSKDFTQKPYVEEIEDSKSYDFSIIFE